MKKMINKILLFLLKKSIKLARQEYLSKLRARGLKVGKNLKILQDVIIDESHCWHIEIGNDVTLAPRVHILAHDASTKSFLGYTKIGKVRIGNRVFIGAGSVVLPGVTIGDDVIVGAGSVVTKDIPPRSVAAGNPAKVIESLDTFLERRKKEMDVSPVFSEFYTLRYGVNDSMKREMNEKMEEKIGYIK